LNAKRKPKRRQPSRAIDQITLRRVGPGNEHELVFPRSVEQRAADMEEVRKMLAVDEIDVAEDELRWLVGGCDALLEGHKLLGRIAAGDENWEIARAHYAYAYELGLDAVKKVTSPVALPYSRPANHDLHEAARGLIESLLELDERALARQVKTQMLAWDPSDPLGVKEMDT
jgi:hypothetical protein